MRHLAVDGVADERVDEGQRRLGAQDLRAGQHAGGRGDRRLVDLGERGDGGEARALAEHRDRAGDRELVRRLAREPHEHGARHRARPDLAHEAGARRVRAHALGLERAQQLAHEQRVAARGAVHRGGERGRRLGAERGVHERGRRRRR